MNNGYTAYQRLTALAGLLKAADQSVDLNVLIPLGIMVQENADELHDALVHAQDTVDNLQAPKSPKLKAV